MTIIKSQQQNKTIFIPCNCKNEILVIEYDNELEIADLCIYETLASFSHKLSWKQRLIYCWRVLWTGHPFTDQTILDKKQLKQLLGFLSILNLH
jgi:hypothetical protein